MPRRRTVMRRPGRERGMIGANVHRPLPYNSLRGQVLMTSVAMELAGRGTPTSTEHGDADHNGKRLST